MLRTLLDLGAQQYQIPQPQPLNLSLGPDIPTSTLPIGSNCYVPAASLRARGAWQLRVRHVAKRTWLE